MYTGRWEMEGNCGTYLQTRHDHEEFSFTEAVLVMLHEAGGGWRQVKGTP